MMEPTSRLSLWVFLDSLSRVPRELLEIGPVLRDGILVIRRFTGGGTVVVDSGTVFVALICKKDAVAGLQPYPRPIMSWSGQGLVTSTFVKMVRKLSSRIKIIASNYTIFASACYLFKFEEVLACSLSLTLYVAVSMQYSARNHLEFTCRMKDYMPREVFIDKTAEALETKFSLRTIEFEALELDAKFSPSTKLLLRHELDTMAFAS
ncbi:hypothetical protein FNV43_RR09680 [Rhamnella rubrinervis]|uniref:BPL/LPL catalytic domain-containing protein n=1 Tax=Rhamnella rubrinervis TaxID=2594499 RepID=A0A8K0HB58_9ROSA|nr:hypothetical protein FNV43_RR09680 [Rhamnella rubrinervis]